MATPGQLVQVMADVLGISKATVTQYDRALAENGLRSKGGRGTSAAKITSRDAANLLIAIAASPLFGLSARDAVRNFKTYDCLSAVSRPSSKNFSSFGLPALDDLPEEHSFGEALAALIDGAGKGQVFSHPERKSKRVSTTTFFEVQFVGPGPSAQILADGSRDFSLLARRIYLANSPKKRSRARSTPLIFGDLRQTSSISFSIIRALGSLVWGGPAWKDEVDARHFWPADALPGRAKALHRSKSS